MKLVEPKVYIVDDDASIRKALTRLMRSEGIASEDFESAESFISRAADSAYGALIVDVRMPDMSGLELHSWLSSNKIYIPAIFITGHGDVPMAVKVMRENAVDFIEKPYKSEHLLEKVKYCFMLHKKHKLGEAAVASAIKMIADLTAREREVMELIVKGMVNKEMARELNLSTRTVEAHRARVMEKLKAHTPAEIIHVAYMANPELLNH